MSGISDLIKTHKGVLAVKEKLNTLPEEQLQKPNIKALIQQVLRAERHFIALSMQDSHHDKMMVLIKKLESRFPKAFNFDHPKPLKSLIVMDILDTDALLPEEKLYKAVKYYKSRETYQESFLEHTHTIDLEGKAYEEINEELRARVMQKTSKIIGRIAAIGKFGEGFNDQAPKAPVAIIEDIKLYYKDNITAELKQILAEAFGRVAFPTVEYSLKGRIHIATCTIINTDQFSQGAGITKIEAQLHAYSNLLMSLQEKGMAYPFECLEKMPEVELPIEDILPEIEVVEIAPKIIKPKVVKPKVIKPKVIKPKIVTPKVFSSKAESPEVDAPKVDTCRAEISEEAETPKVKSAQTLQREAIKAIEEKKKAARSSSETPDSPYQKELTELLSSLNKSEATYSIEKIVDLPPYLFEATCYVDDLELTAQGSDGSPRKAREEAAIEMIRKLSKKN